MNGSVNVPYRFHPQPSLAERLVWACIGITGTAFAGALFAWCMNGGLVP